MEKFKLEYYLGQYEFAPELEMMGSSDMQGWDMKALLEMAQQKHLKLWNDLNLGYTEVKGHPLLRQEIQKTYQKQPEIIVTSGAEEALYAALKGILTSNDHVIIMTPCYQSHYEIPHSLGCEVSEWILTMDENWEPNIDKLKKLIQKNTKLILICMPHNPTGMICKGETYQALISIAREHDIYILNDEVYHFMEHDLNDQLPQIADAYEKGISVNVMTKAYGLAGLRIGWIASQDKSVIDAAEKMKHYLSICSSAPSEILSIIALDQRNKILSENKAYMSKNFELFKKFIAHYQTLFEWIPPKGGCIGLVKIKFGSAEKFCNEIREHIKCLLLPGSVFNLGDQYFRIGFGRKNFPELLSRLENFIKDKAAIYESGHF